MWKNTYAVISVFAFCFIACSDENPAISPIESSSNNFSSSSVQGLDSSSSSVLEESSSSVMNVEISSADIVKLSSSNEVSSSSSENSSSSLEQSSSSLYVSHNIMTDERDGQIYKTVTIGKQTWMAENLNFAYTQPINGLDSGSWCYNNDTENCAKYGRLYTWDAAVDSKTYSAEFERYLKAYQERFYYRNNPNWHSSFLANEGDFNVPGSCPKNWHIPSENEWEILIFNVNNFATDLKSTSGWLDDGNGTDIYGFRVLPAVVIGKRACFWGSRQSTNVLEDISPVEYFERAVAFCFFSDDKVIYSHEFIKENAFSVRCVKDSTEAE